MIVRVLGQGQFRLDAAVFNGANEIDDRLLRAVEANDSAAFDSALAELVSLIMDEGERVPDAEIVQSDAIVPGTDTSLEEVHSLLSDDGLIPG